MFVFNPNIADHCGVQLLTVRATATVLIVNWNAGDYLLRCIQSIPEKYPIIIVDNNSRDGSIEKVALQFPRIRVIKSSVNLGYSAGNNVGLTQVNTQYVLFLNPDTEIIGDALDLMVNFLDNHPEYDAVGPKIIDRDGSTSQLSGRRHFNLWIGLCEAFLLDKIFPQNRWFNYRHIPEWDRQNSRDIDCLVGCAMLMRTDVVKRLGGFDQSVPLYLDDNDLCRKITEAGGKIRCLAGANIWHIHKISSDQAPNTWVTFLNLKASYIYLKKYSKADVANIYLVFLSIAGSIRVILFFLASFINSKYRINLKTSWDILLFILFYRNSASWMSCPE
jgi:GT2 family glycosyltransferase